MDTLLGDVTLAIIKWNSDWWSIEVVVINHGISHHDVYYGGGGGSAVSRDFQQISGKFQSGPIWLRKWSDMASKVGRYDFMDYISDHFEN